MDRSELTGVTAAALARMVRKRDVSATEVTMAHLERIEALDGAINSVVVLDSDAALAAARRLDEARDRGNPVGRLQGVPFTVKDNIEAAGLPIAIGVPERGGIVAARNATAVARLEQAGAILLGKTKCPPWGAGIETDNPVHGRTANPYDPARTPGGSSGGAAAAVAGGFSTLALGTDSGASVRLPAHFCGVAAIKPTAGLVPVTGVIDDEGQIGGLSDPRTQVGPLARSVADVALALAAIAGPDGRDGATVPVPFGDPATVDLRGAHVALCADDGLTAPTAETADTVRRAAAALGDAGATVAEAPYPRGGHELTLEIWSSYGGGMGAGELYRVLRRWDAFRAEMLAFAEDHDVVVCPVFPSPALPHGTMTQPGRPDPTSYTTPFSVSGWPAATVRAGGSADGLPIGVQLVAPPWRDELALAAAIAVERALGGWSEPRLAATAPATPRVTRG
jgi:amidase